MSVSGEIAITVGRDDGNSYVVKHSSVSSRHCVIRFENGHWEIEDLRSTNGTFVNGNRVTTARLEAGDRVLLGLTEYVFENGELVLAATHRSAVDQSRQSGQRHGLKGLHIFAAALVISASVVALAITLSLTEGSTTQGSDPAASNNLFSSPRDLDLLIQSSRPSVLGVECSDDSGTGWVLNTGTSIVAVTNVHVIERCLEDRAITLYSDQGRLSAPILGVDEFNDLALLGLKSGMRPLPTASVPPIGSWLMVIGNSLGLDRSVTYGTLTNISDGWIITDAAINPGNSGGPVFDARGRVIGIATAKLVEDGVDRVGLVVPLKTLCEALLSCSDKQWE